MPGCACRGFSSMSDVTVVVCLPHLDVCDRCPIDKSCWRSPDVNRCLQAGLQSVMIEFVVDDGSGANDGLGDKLFWFGLALIIDFGIGFCCY